MIGVTTTIMITSTLLIGMAMRVAFMRDMNTKMLDNKPLYVALAQRKDVRRQQLEAQYATRVKGIGSQLSGQPQMFPGQPGPPPMGFYPGS